MIHVPASQMSFDMYKMMSDRFSDVELEVTGSNGLSETLRAHKAVLAARCPVFDAMFRDGFVEQRNVRKKITFR